MKKLVPIALINLITLGAVQAQFLTVETYYERTTVSPKTGTAIGYVFNCQMQAGAFYQVHSMMLSGEDKKPYRLEEKFMGVYMSAPIKEWKKVTLILKARTGIVNGENFAISPSIHVDYNVAKKIHLNAGVALRFIVPSVMTGIRIDLGKYRSRRFHRAYRIHST